MTVIGILGMHRSGTSCLAGSLQAAGLFAGEVQEWNADNSKGQRENLDIMQLNNEILKSNNASWRNPPKTFVFSQEHQARRDQIIADYYHHAAIWMFKDPRTVLMLSFWHEGLPDLQCIASFRHPLSVAMSLYQRNQMAIRDGLQLWLDYNRCLIEAWQHSPFPLICFDLTQEQYLSKIKETIAFLNSKTGESVHLETSAALAFYDSQLVHERELVVTFTESYIDSANAEENALLTCAINLYEELKQAAGLAVAKQGVVQKQGYLIPLKETIEECCKILELQPDNPKVYFILGNLQREQGELDKAISSYKAAIDLEPENINIYKILGSCYQDINCPQRAVDMYREALLTNPNNPELYCLLGKIQQKNGEMDAAIASYQAARTIFPKYLQAHINLGHVFYQQEQFVMAIECYQAILQIQPSNIHAYLQLGDIARKQANFEQAVAYFDRALAFNSGSFEAYKKKGDTLKQLEKWNEAIRVYHKARELQPKNFFVNLELGHVFKQIGRFEEALASYQLASEIKPDNVLVYRCMGNVLWQQGNKQGALANYQNAIKLDPQQPFGIYKNLGDGLKQQNRIQEALVAYMEALRIIPNHPAVCRSMDELKSKLIDSAS